MCFNYKIGSEPEPTGKLGDQFLIILTFDPSGMARVTTLGAPPIVKRSESLKGRRRRFLPGARGRQKKS
jgi:hypothetical protein